MYEFPVDDLTLSMIEDALNTSVAYDENGEPYLVGGEYTLGNFLDFLSGPSDYSHVDEHLTIRDLPRYSEYDVMRALIAEVRRLRRDHS